MWCATSEYYVHIHLSNVEFHVLCVDVTLDLGFHVVIGVGRLTVQFHHAYAILSTKFFSS